MSEPKDGGPAFPQTWENEAYGTNGMSLRDYFAGQAISSMPNRSWDHLPNDVSRINAWADAAYSVADAMLAARKKES